jgi:hypothetical protein
LIRMVSLDFIDEKSKAKIVGIWKAMDENDKGHFINQVALALSIFGSEEKGRRIVIGILDMMCSNGTNTLADFGLYVDKAVALPDASGMGDKVKRAAIILEGYRIKNGLPSEPHHDLDF